MDIYLLAIIVGVVALIAGYAIGRLDELRHVPAEHAADACLWPECDCPRGTCAGREGMT